MIPESKLATLRAKLKDATNPLFLFDDDLDGLCSFLLLRRFTGCGVWHVVKAKPIIDESLLPAVGRTKPDLVVVLDKPDIEQVFLDSLPCEAIWIDHHSPVERAKVDYYNPLCYTSTYTPTTAVCWAAVDGPLWIAAAGCIGDWALPEFLPKIVAERPDLFPSMPTEPGQVVYDFPFGKVMAALSSCLKGKGQDVRRATAALTKIEQPDEILNESSSAGALVSRKYKKFSQLYRALFDQAARQRARNNLFVFVYSGPHAFGGELANELAWRMPKKVVLIGREKAGWVRLSLRAGRAWPVPIREALLTALKGIKGYGGGHPLACGANVKREDLDRFLTQFAAEIDQVLKRSALH